MLQPRSINIFNYCMELERSERLINTLQNVNKRYCSMFFSKLVLFDQQPSQEISFIRHYDLQCEAAQNIFSILQTKVKAISLRALYKIQRHTEQKTMTPIRGKIKFIRSNAENTNNSFSKLSNSRNALSSKSLYQPISPQYRQIYESPKQNVRLELHSNPQLQEIDRSISILMGRVKNLSDKFNRKAKNYMHNEQRDRINKRKIILSKLNQLENDLSTYLQRDQQKQEQRQNYLCKTPSQQTANFLTSSKYSQKMNMTTQTRNHSDFYQESNRQDKSETGDKFYLKNYNSKSRFRFSRDSNQEGLKPIQFQNKDDFERLLNVKTTSDLLRKKFFK